jgi:predicted transcriptional regulator
VTTKEALHRLVDELPETVLPEAERYLASLRDDPVPRAFIEAPEDDEPLTPEEVAAIEEGKAEIARGEGIPWEEYLARRRDNA